MKQPSAVDIEQITRALEAGGPHGSDALIEFADRWGHNSEVRNRALLLKAQYIDASHFDHQEIAPVRQSMLDLVASIANASPLVGQGDGVDQAKLQRVYDRFRNRDIERATVCESQRLSRRNSRTFSLTDLSLKLRLGEVTGVVGANGAGKTTLLRILAGERRRTGGDLYYPALGGRSSARVDWSVIKRSIAYVPQVPRRLYGSLRTNLHYAAAIHGVTGQANDMAVRFIVERLGLNDEMDKRWSALSTGFRLRVALAHALIGKPKLLLLDEPFANLDFETQGVVIADIRDLANSYKNPMSVVLSSQHLREVETVSDRILHLSNGKPAFYGNTVDIGKDRIENVFEVATGTNLIELLSKQPQHGIRRIQYDGLSYLIVTDRDVTADSVLKWMIDNKVAVRGFSNLTSSVKSLFMREVGDA